MTGNVSIDSNGDRSADYVLLMMKTTKNAQVSLLEQPELCELLETLYPMQGEEVSSDEMVPVAKYLGRTNSFGQDDTSVIYWPGRGVGSPPPDTPQCGFDGSLCDKRQWTYYIT